MNKIESFFLRLAMFNTHDTSVFRIYTCLFRRISSDNARTCPKRRNRKRPDQLLPKLPPRLLTVISSSHAATGLIPSHRQKIHWYASDNEAYHNKGLDRFRKYRSAEQE